MDFTMHSDSERLITGTGDMIRGAKQKDFDRLPEGQMRAVRAFVGGRNMRWWFVSES